MEAKEEIDGRKEVIFSYRPVEMKRTLRHSLDFKAQNQKPEVRQKPQRKAFILEGKSPINLKHTRRTKVLKMCSVLYIIYNENCFPRYSI